jgi:hypothetical protein
MHAKVRGFDTDLAHSAGTAAICKTAYIVRLSAATNVTRASIRDQHPHFVCDADGA